MHPLRRLATRPGFSLTVIGTLALGLGLATAILSLLYEVFFKPLPYPEPARLAAVFDTFPERGWTRNNVSMPEVRDIAERATLFSEVSAYAAFRTLNLTGNGP